MRRKIIELMGGFPDVETALRHIEVGDVKNKREVLRLAVQDLFLAINPDDVLHIDTKGNMSFMGKPLSKEQTAEIVVQAEAFARSRLWAVLRWDIRHQLSRKMFEEGKVAEDFVWGQLATFLFDVIKTRLKKIAEISSKI